MKNLLKKITPDAVWNWLRRRRPLRFGSFKRTTPISRGYGMERGTPVDRFYIEQFLEQRASDVFGHVLEFADNSYTTRFGGTRVTKSDVWHSRPGNPQATIVGDLADADHVSSNQFDCIICTQVLMYVYDLRAALRTLHRLLKPGGSLLITVPGIAQVTRYDMDRWGDYWRFTTLSMQRLLSEDFPNDTLSVESHGNVFSAMAYLHGLAQEDVRREDLTSDDPDYRFVITARAAKPARIQPSLNESSKHPTTKETIGQH